MSPAHAGAWVLACASLCAALLVAPPAPAATSAAVRPGPAAMSLLRPILKLRVESARAHEDWQGLRLHEALRRLRALYRDRSSAADEALALLTFVTFGRAPDDDHDCEVLDRGTRMLPLLRRFHDGAIDTGFDLRPVARRSAVEEASYRRLLVLLERGEICQGDAD